MKMLSDILFLFFGKLFLGIEGGAPAGGGDGSSGGSGGDAGAAGGASGGEGAGKPAEGDKAGDAKPADGAGAAKLPEGFDAERWEKIKDIDPARWEKLKDIDPELHGKAKSFYETVSSNPELFKEVSERLEKLQKDNSNPAVQKIQEELRQHREFIEGQKREKFEAEQREYKTQFDTEFNKTRDEVAKEMKLENLTAMEQEVINSKVMKQYAEDQAKGDQSKLTIADLKTLVTNAVKEIDGHRREILKNSVKRDTSPAPIKDGSTADLKPERDLKSKDSRVEDAQKYFAGAKA